jgi:hypothetical protein
MQQQAAALQHQIKKRDGSFLFESLRLLCLSASSVMHALWSASSVMMHALTEINALLKMFYTTKEIIGNCPKMNRLKKTLIYL